MTEGTSSDVGGDGSADEAVFTRGIDYVSAWREANVAVQELLTAAEAVGLDVRVVRAVPHAGANGAPVVWFSPEGVRLIAAFMRSVPRGDAGAQNTETGGGTLAGKGWQTRAGSKVRVVREHDGEFIHCDGCPRPIRITGVGSSAAAARRHANSCRK